MDLDDGYRRPACRNRAGYACETPNNDVSDSTPETVHEGDSLTSSGYHISVDEGRDSFYALCIEDPDDEDRWLMSDTVRSLRDLR